MGRGHALLHHADRLPADDQPEATGGEARRVSNLDVLLTQQLAQAIKVLARAHQRLVWSRQRQVNGLRSILRGFYLAALAAFADLDDRDAVAVLGPAPTPARGRRLSRLAIAAALRRAGRQF